MASRFGETVRTILSQDPAAKSWVEVVLCYPTLHVQLFHRVAHPLYRLGVPVLPRLLMQVARFLTGIEIHPGARIGRRLFIDHGMGVVVGETAVIGDDCLIYHGVTLGGTGKDLGKRHPTLGNGVVIGSGAAVLGNITVGDGARIGANSVVLRDIPVHATVVGIPGRVVMLKGHPVEAPKAETMPDPEAEAIKALADRIYRLESDIHVLRAAESTQRWGHDTSAHETLLSTNGNGRHAQGAPEPMDEVDDFIHGAGI